MWMTTTILPVEIKNQGKFWSTFGEEKIDFFLAIFLMNSIMNLMCKFYHERDRIKYHFLDSDRVL